MRRLVVRLLSAPLAPRRAPARSADAAVVLGSPISGGGLTAVGEERVRAGVEIWRRGLAPVVCFSGAGGEAAVMAARARALGLPQSAMRMEPTARSTAENATASAALLAAEGRRVVWVVTQPFHLRRALRCFRQSGLVPLPWHIADSVQFRSRRAHRWIAREYAAWLVVPISSRRRGSRATLPR